MLTWRWHKRNNRDQMTEAGEAGNVVCKQLLDLVYLHRGDNVGVVNLLPGCRNCLHQIEQEVKHQRRVFHYGEIRAKRLNTDENISKRRMTLC